ncbi:small ribosomal subunit Rsm22 family protein [Oleiharenicola lentus]|uniref:small ribosomal subunit Rsm22 family protein n=1 Tax=Oleiharenicola lentus TaxID=2508720 RepID=UPI003F66D29B
MDWDSLDWEVLDRLRETFLTDVKTRGPYWHTITDLECYNFTYGERIGWKWDAVLAELKQRGWIPPSGGPVLDWGCGSGIAGRRVVDFFGAENFPRLLVHDHSELAMEFSTHHGRRLFPTLTVERAGNQFLESDEPIGVLVVSHVLNELNAEARAQLAALAARAQSIIWVEPGTHEASRLLGGWREQLRGAGVNVVAPCTHQNACGMFAPGNERHWCHFFAAPPANIYADSQWVKFGQRAGIDLRSLPYSFLVVDRRPVNQAAGYSRIIGEARHYKGYAKIFNCDASGLTELMMQKRDAPELFKALKHSAGPELHQWTHVNGRITHIES